MNFVVWLIAGGLIGWAASRIMNADGHQAVALDIVIGVLGAQIGGSVITPLVGVDTFHQSNFSIAGLMSAVGLLVMIKAVQRSSIR
jgi:uncharacterized membrane protein YeaQ/YmgE (transglycosylase-associated protein family)